MHIALETNRAIDPSECSAALAGILPAGVNIRLHLLNAIPRNGTGKLQRNLLKQHLGF